ncbi:MAG TPA: ABC transporter permease [Verrucomicrobiae bacterium]|nr:ABC transporter permease [Verrucomicrobiae bacterium]
MSATWVIARLTVRELVRRRLVLALVLLTAVVIGLTGWGFARVPGLHDHGQPLTAGEARTVAAELLLLVMFMFSFVLALTCAFLAAPAIAQDLESGVALALLARPLRRAELLLGRWLGLVASAVVYTVLASTAELLVVALTTGYVPRQPLQAEAALCVEGVCLLTLVLGLSTRLATVTGAVVAVIAFGATWMGGVAGAFGQVFNNAPIRDVGTVTHLLLPTDGMWRAATFSLEPAVFASQAAQHAGAGAFQSASGPTVAYLAWVAAWLVVVLAAALWSFQRREA